MIIKFQKRKRGFGILEVLISGVIIIIILGALVVLARNAINNSQYVQERSQAVNLAQEGIEIVRQIRDTSYYSANNWNQMVCNSTENRLDLTVLAPDISYRFKWYSPSPGNKTNLDAWFCLEPGTGTGVNLAGNNFYRTVRFYNIGGSGSQILSDPTNKVKNNGVNGVIVEVVVTWPTASGDHNVNIRELITDNKFQF